LLTSDPVSDAPAAAEKLTLKESVGPVPQKQEPFAETGGADDVEQTRAVAGPLINVESEVFNEEDSSFL